MFPNWIIYIILLLIITSLGVYYKKLNDQKTFLENFDQNYSNNSVLKSYDIYNGSYQNLVEKNNKLDENLKNNQYGNFYNTLFNNFFRLNQDSGKIVDDINRKGEIINKKMNSFNQELARDSNFKNDNVLKIINKYTKQVDQSYSNPKGNIQRGLDRVINQTINGQVDKYAANIPENEKVINSINNKYNDGLKVINNQLNGMKITFSELIEQDVKNAVIKKKETMPTEDLSSNPGILVRIYNSPTQNPNGNSFGTLSKEYIVPAINYYMTNRIDPFFSSNKMAGTFRYLEFLGNILIPGDASTIEFKLESAAGSRFYFAGELLIDQFSASTSVDSNSKINYVTPRKKIPYKLQTYEGLDNTLSYIMLKWRINQSGNYVAIPMEYFFLPNLIPY